MKKFAVSALVSSMAASLVGLGLWFAPTHGQPNEDRAQLIDVTVVDDEGDAVVGAPITVQRHDGTQWVSTRRGGASDAAGEKSLEMPTAMGSYRIVLTVPQGYTEWYDDADRNNPGRNGECTGMVARCVAYDIDAAGTVTLNQPDRGADGMAFTFYVTDNNARPRIAVTQRDAGGNAVAGGTVTMQPYAIVDVDGQKVRRWGRVSRTGMTTANRTFTVERNTSYVVTWEPPEGWFKLVPSAPGFSYEVTTGAKGTMDLPFIVHRPAAQNDSGIQLDSDVNEIAPPHVPEQPSDEGGAGDDQPNDEPPVNPDAQDQASGGDWSTPVETIPADVVPTGTVPTETTPEVTIPTETVPTETVPEDTIPEVTIPTETVPEDTIPEVTIPTETVPEENETTDTIPEVTIPTETVPEDTIPDVTIPTETVPEENETIDEEAQAELELELGLEQGIAGSGD